MVWQKGGFGNQWQINEPIRKEIQRIMPEALEGLHATNSIAFGDVVVQFPIPILLQNIMKII